MRPLVLASLVILQANAGLSPAPLSSVPAVELPAWEQKQEGESEHFKVGVEKANVWGTGQAAARHYSPEFLPAVFMRTLVFDSFNLQDGTLDWIFTGPQGGVTVSVSPTTVTLSQRYYDSFGLHENGPKAPAFSRHPEKVWCRDDVRCSGDLRAVTLFLDHALQARLSLNGRHVVTQECLLDLSRHQIGATGGVIAEGNVIRPKLVRVTVAVDPKVKHQTMLGFGGIGTPPAYAQLSREGKRRWWKLVAEYNLLIQREYPIGTRLNEDMNNWDALEDATPHYYGDNFPNGEISDFSYIRTLHQLGGHVFFEFWALPPWTRRAPESTESESRANSRAPDFEKYAEAVVAYCRASVERTGFPPDVVGIQNEVRQSGEAWYGMTLALRRALDEAGFQSVKIHMSDSGSIGDGTRRAGVFRANAEVWDAIDYTATHQYDYQRYFHDPDGFDELIQGWLEAAGDEKPFLSTELCVNSPNYQVPAYRLAFSMGQIYHKNLTMLDAAAICYCWTILNVQQPSYGWTRSLCVPDPSEGHVPVPSSHQLRVFGAFSRRIREGMRRIEAKSSDADLLVSAFSGDKGEMTIVALNRSASPFELETPDSVPALPFVEIADPYHENEVLSVSRSSERGRITIEPGSIVTLSNVPLTQLPEDFEYSSRKEPFPLAR